MIKRLGLVFHWIGFLCLTGIIAAVVITKPTDVAWSEIPAALWELLIFDNSSDIALTLVLWIAISHLPIKYILTGDKSVFPWNRGSSND
tara:strand:- start:121 stop:387 length:267 start_codon:yes stop_codon:yes gene_type:complete